MPPGAVFRIIKRGGALVKLPDDVLDNGLRALGLGGKDKIVASGVGQKIRGAAKS